MPFITFFPTLTLLLVQIGVLFLGVVLYNVWMLCCLIVVMMAWGVHGKD